MINTFLFLAPSTLDDDALDRLIQRHLLTIESILLEMKDCWRFKDKHPALPKLREQLSETAAELNAALSVKEMRQITMR